MKNFLKKWCFSIVLWTFALLIFIYGIIMNFIDEELFYKVGMLCCYATLAILCITIGVANQPEKEKKQ